MEKIEKTEGVSFQDFSRKLCLENVMQYSNGNQHFFDCHSVNLLNFVDKVFSKVAAAGFNCENDLGVQEKIQLVLVSIYYSYFMSLECEVEYGVNTTPSINEQLDELLLQNFGIEKDAVRKPAN